MQQIVSRTDALNSGLPRYFTGVPCGKGHVEERIASSRKCVACNREYQAKLHNESPHRRPRAPKMSDDERKRRRRKAYQANRKTISQIRRIYYQENRDKVSVYERERFNRDPMFALSKQVRARLRIAFHRKGYSKKSRTFEMLGCDWNTLASHIESQFSDGMSWDNRAEWHIDHIIPLSSAETEEELIALCHYSNLQPLWASDNLSKGAKILPEHAQQKLAI